jgi:hypothetical protein
MFSRSHNGRAPVPLVPRCEAANVTSAHCVAVTSSLLDNDEDLRLRRAPARLDARTQHASARRWLRGAAGPAHVLVVGARADAARRGQQDCSGRCVHLRRHDLRAALLGCEQRASTRGSDEHDASYSRAGAGRGQQHARGDRGGSRLCACGHRSSGVLGIQRTGPARPRRRHVVRERHPGDCHRCRGGRRAFLCSVDGRYGEMLGRERSRPAWGRVRERPAPNPSR